MVDREKVIKFLELCTSNLPIEKCIDNKCPYFGRDEDRTCFDLLMWDALALLKEQEPRLVVEADFENADDYGFLPVWVEYKDDSEIICDCITKAALADMDSGYHYRYWTSCPTDEQREVTPWDG